jgi:hypothetical protein
VGRQWHALGTWWRSSTIESIVIGFVPFVLPSSYPLQDMGSRSHTPPSARPADRSLSRSRSRSPSYLPSPRRSISPRSKSDSRSRSRTPLPRDSRNGYRAHRDTSRSLTRSRSPSRGAGSRIYRERSYTRSPSRHGKIVVEKAHKKCQRGSPA